MSYQTESILKAALAHFRSMSPKERHAAIDAAAARARRAARRSDNEVTARAWDLCEHRVLDVREAMSPSVRIPVPTTKPSVVIWAQEVGSSSVVVAEQYHFVASQGRATKHIVPANSDLEFRPTQDQVIAA
jgi:hypothetical protein